MTKLFKMTTHATVFFSLALGLTGFLNLEAITYDDSQLLISYWKTRRSILDAEVKRVKEISFGRDASGVCIKETHKRVDGLNRRPKDKTKKVKSKYCHLPVVESTNASCKRTRHIIKNYETPGQYGTADLQMIDLDTSCHCTQWRSLEIFSRFKTWINPLNITQGPVYTFIDEMRACNPEQLEFILTKSLEAR